MGQPFQQKGSLIANGQNSQTTHHIYPGREKVTTFPMDRLAL